MVKSKIQYPKCCYSVIPSSGQFIRIDRHESNFTIMKKYDKHVFGEEAKALANELNKAAGISHAVRNAMEHGSMFGWDTLGADPESEWNKESVAL